MGTRKETVKLQHRILPKSNTEFHKGSTWKGCSLQAECYTAVINQLLFRQAADQPGHVLCMCAGWR